MANIHLLQTLIPLLSYILILTTNAISHKTSFSFHSFPSNSSRLTYQGDAHVPPSSSSLRLTKIDADGLPRPDSIGRVLYSKPVQFNWSDDLTLCFSSSIKFNITITPVVGCSPADGLAFFIAPVGSTIPRGSGGGNLGIFDARGSGSRVFAVEIDLFVNEWDAVRGDHVGIDINSRYSSRAVGFDASCLWQEMELNVVHDGGMFSVMLACGGGAGSRVVEYEYDLSSFLPQEVVVGISASTGSCFALFDVNFWSFESFMKPKTRLKN